MHTGHHPIPRRPIGAVLAARRRENAAIVARCRAFGMIAETLAHYGRHRGPTLTGADRRGRWEQLGDYAGVAASAEAAQLRTSSTSLRTSPEGGHPHAPDGFTARSWPVAPATRSAETRS